jgi:uncharacterized CHY-type Zn-finger protein
MLGIPTQWNLDFPPNGTVAGFVPYEPEATTPKPYDFSCFQCHTTGSLPLDEDFPEYQENRRGFAGTWQEPGVQCEECHGPGAEHFGTVAGQVQISKERIFVDLTGDATCKTCHNRPYNDQSGMIPAKGGFIQHHEQWPELRASGGHAEFACTVCHDPHTSVIYDRANAIRASCLDCHPDASMAGHRGKVFERGDYREELSCESCHMPFATKSASAATAAVVGEAGRMGDTRTHIFRISTATENYTQFFTEDGTQVRRDGDGRAAVTVDFVCLRCHNDVGAFGLSVDRASEIGLRIHQLPE